MMSLARPFTLAELGIDPEQRPAAVDCPQKRGNSRVNLG